MKMKMKLNENADVFRDVRHLQMTLSVIILFMNVFTT